MVDDRWPETEVRALVSLCESRTVSYSALGNSWNPILAKQFVPNKEQWITSLNNDTW